MLKRVVLKGAALSIAPCLALVACLWPLAIFISYGYPPCENNGWLHIVSRIIMPLACAVGAWLIIRAATKNIWKYFFVGCAVAFTTVLITWLAYLYDAANQKACVKRSLSEAIKACKVNPKYVRRSTDSYGNPTFTLASLGTTYEGRMCLTHWSVHKGSVSLVKNMP
jgi:hypothetical protein